LQEEGLNQPEPLCALETRHRILWGDATDMAALADASIDLVVTSPPYPMIEMWDRVFKDQSAEAAQALSRGRGGAAFEAMHQVLDRVWRSLWRVMRPGAIACINIGDAVRTIGGLFTLYPNHTRILSALLAIGFNPLPAVIWRKQTNAPNKFMGSGMLPAGAYVTLEHEFVLVARKGDKRDFSSASGKQRRHESAYFWEERNQWFSDIWFDLKGSRQKLSKSERQRSGAFPVELAYRLVNMYAVRGDTVLDPFLGTGSTMIAAMAAERHSIGVEIDGSLAAAVQAGIDEMIPWANDRIGQRLESHRAFVAEREKTHGPLRHRNVHYGFPVVTAQERQLRLHRPMTVRRLAKDVFAVDYVAENPHPTDADTPAPLPTRTRRKSVKSVVKTAPSRGQSTLPGF
jgi:modification methylase